MSRIVKVVFLKNHVIISYDTDEETEYILARIIDDAVEEKEDNK